jgi:hypothetical protein
LQVRNTRPDFKEEILKVIKNIVGHVKVTEFTAAHAAFFEKERKKSVAAPTVNRGLAVLSHMFTFALKTKGIIQIHPMTRCGRIAVLAKNHVSAGEGSVARSAGTVLCRTQGGWFGMGGISRFPAFPGESMGHERNQSADRSGIVATSGYHDDDAVLALRAESRGEKYPGGAPG